MPHGRKKPFSGKAKKIQLQAKKQNKRVWEGNGKCPQLFYFYNNLIFLNIVLFLGNSSRSTLLVRGSSDEEEDEINVQKVNYQPEKGRGSGRNNSNR